MATVDRAAEYPLPKELVMAATGLGVAGLLAAASIVESIQIRLTDIAGVQLFTRFKNGLEVNEYGIYGMSKQPCPRPRGPIGIRKIPAEMQVSELIFGFPRLMIDPPDLWFEKSPGRIVDRTACLLSTPRP